MWSKRTTSNLTHAALAFLIATLGPVAMASDIEDVAYRIHVGATQDDMLGFAVAGLGDVNNDGVRDYVIGAPGVGPFFEGHAYVMSGANGNIIRDFAIGLSLADLGGYSVANAGDVDADGRDDIIAGAPFADLAQGMVKVYSGRTGQLLHTFHGINNNELTGYSVAGAGDVDGDGHDDVAVSTPYAGGGQVVVYSGASGLPVFSWSGSGKFGYVVVGMGDVNGNGFPDLAISALGQGRVYLFDPHDHELLQTFVGTTSVRFGKTLANAGDVNGDGVNDLIVGFDNGAFVYGGGSDAILLSFLNGLGSTVAGAGDINGDGYGDVIIGDAWTGPPQGGRVEVRSGFDGSMLRVFTRVLAADDYGPAATGLGDIDGDGYADMLIGANRGVDDFGAAYVMLGGPNEMSMLDGGLYPVFIANPTFTLAVDLDRKKNADLITVNGVTSTMYVQMNRGDGTFQYPKFIVTGNNPTSVATLDIDRDGDQDVLVTCAGDNKVRVYRNSNGVLAFVGGIKTGHWPSSVVAADFNRDGFADFAVANRDDDTVTVFLHNKSTLAALNKRFGDGRNFAAGDGPVQLAVGHFDNDAYPDLAVADSQAAQIAVLVNKQNGRFLAPKMLAIDSPATGLLAGDLNNDGLTDLSWVDSAANLVMVSRGLGAGLLEPAASYSTGAQPSGVAFLDMNADGALDLAVSNAGENTVSILLQAAGGMFVASITMPTVIAPECMTALDVDGDDDVDLAVVGGSIGITNVLQNGWF